MQAAATNKALRFIPPPSVSFTGLSSDSNNRLSGFVTGVSVVDLGRLISTFGRRRSLRVILILPEAPKLEIFMNIDSENIIRTALSCHQ